MSDAIVDRVNFLFAVVSFGFDLRGAYFTPASLTRHLGLERSPPYPRSKIILAADGITRYCQY